MANREDPTIARRPGTTRARRADQNYFTIPLIVAAFFAVALLIGFIASGTGTGQFNSSHDTSRPAKITTGSGAASTTPNPSGTTQKDVPVTPPGTNR
jgi:hypothetical protein